MAQISKFLLIHKISEVNLSTFINRLFCEDFSSVIGAVLLG